MNLIAVMVYSHKAGFQEQLERQLSEQEISFIGWQDHDFSWRRRLLLSRDIAKDCPGELLIFLDAWDTLLLGTKQEILDLHLEKGITFAAGKLCWPDFSRQEEYEKKDGHVKSPWRYINSNPMAGLGKNIAEAIDWGWKRFPLKEDTKLIQAQDVCERFLTDLYLKAGKKFDIKLDTECRLNQLYRKSVPGDLYLQGNRIVNLVHRTQPIFLHANGRTVVPPELLDERAS
jgi:hypothetical protein